MNMSDKGSTWWLIKIPSCWQVILREQDINIRESFANSMFNFRGGIPSRNHGLVVLHST